MYVIIPLNSLPLLQSLGSSNRLGTAELTGGTFALSNIGVVGGTYLSPVVVVPQVCLKFVSVCVCVSVCLAVYSSSPSVCGVF